MSEVIALSFQRYLAAQMPHARDLRIVQVARIHGGASRETYRIKAHYLDDGRPVEQGLILRRDPVASLIETERTREFEAYRAFQGSDVPVPRALYLENDPIWMERPFFVMEEIQGCSAASMLAGDPYQPHQRRIGEQFWTILGRIAASQQKVAALGAAPLPGEAWLRELDHWERVIDSDEIEPQPVARAAIRALRRKPPPPAQRISLVHGDYRSGNFLFDGSGTIRAILDWEMAHLGDPLEDLAWALDPLWAHHTPERPAGLIPEAEAIRLWERASGLRAVPEALAWWRSFAMLKGLAIWISSAKAYESGESQDPVLAFPGWYCLAFHNAALAERLADLERGRL